jgi:hypothetical protein
MAAVIFASLPPYYGAGVPMLRFSAAATSPHCYCICTTGCGPLGAYSLTHLPPTRVLPPAAALSASHRSRHATRLAGGFGKRNLNQNRKNSFSGSNLFKPLFPKQISSVAGLAVLDCTTRTALASTSRAFLVNSGQS